VAEKKLDTSLTRAERLTLLEREDADLPLTTQTALLSLNRTSLYYTPVAPSPQEVALKHRIDELYTDRPYYGVRRITAQLRREGIVVNDKAVARHMREMGLVAIYPGPNLSKRAHQAAIYPYLLRDLRAERPNHIWGIDITYIRLVGSWMYLVAVLDLYTRYVVSWALDDTLEQPFVVDAVRRALAQATPVICNSDQGSHFTSAQYTGELSAAGVQISMNGRGRALDNVFIERLWRTVKYEDVDLRDYTAPRETRLRLGQYLTHYNEQRPHSSLEYRTPAAVYFGKEHTSTAA
jgi:putative transposase